MNETFHTLKTIMQQHTGHMKVIADTSDHYALLAGYSEKWKKDVWFGAVRLGKRYVSYHLMPVYACPQLLADVSPELKKRMQGKACFNFKTLDAKQARELSRLTRKSVSRFRKEGLIQPHV